MSTISKINVLLKNVNKEERLRRSPAGYYYIEGLNASGLYVYHLSDTDFQLAKDYVNESFGCVIL
jgi:hypothetical protein